MSYIYTNFVCSRTNATNILILAVRNTCKIIFVHLHNFSKRGKKEAELYVSSGNFTNILQGLLSFVCDAKSVLTDFFTISQLCIHVVL